MVSEISSSLEDYLETIYLLQQEQGFARVKEIASARDVKAASVSVALRKLADSGLVKYERREYISLTEQGETAARRVFSRHRLLKRFFSNVLQMDTDAADEQACALEHSLTDVAMDRFVSFFEFLGNNPAVIADFSKCLSQNDCQHIGTAKQCHHCNAVKNKGAVKTIASLEPGESATVCTINSTGPVRQKLLDMGILPDTMIEIERHGLNHDPIHITVQGAKLVLTKSEAELIIVE